jgi:hypothetical protein
MVLGLDLTAITGSKDMNLFLSPAQQVRNEHQSTFNILEDSCLEILASFLRLGIARPPTNWKLLCHSMVSDFLVEVSNNAYLDFFFVYVRESGLLHPLALNIVFKNRERPLKSSATF